MRQDCGASDCRGVIRVLLVVDADLVRAGIRAFLERANASMRIVGETGRGAEAVALARSLRPDVVILDIRLSKTNAFAVARALRRRLPRVGIVVLTHTHDDDEDAQALQAVTGIGVHRCLAQPASSATLSYAVRAARRDTEEVALGAGYDGWDRELRLDDRGASLLSDRECDTLRGVGCGLSSKQIARELGISPHTVNQHIESARAKLKAPSRGAAAMTAMQRWPDLGLFYSAPAATTGRAWAPSASAASSYGSGPRSTATWV